VAYVLKWYASWNISIYIMGALYLIGAIAWCVVRPRDRILRPGETQSNVHPAGLGEGALVKAKVG